MRAFGLHPGSILVPQALMGVAAVGLTYDLVRRRFGRLAGFAGGHGDGLLVEYLAPAPAGAGREARLVGGGDNAEVVYN